MGDLLVWVPIIASGSSIIAWIKFWMDAGADRQRITNLDAMQTAIASNVELLKGDLSQFKLQAAHDFASTSDLAAAERRFANAVDGLGSRFDRMAERLDRVLESISHAGRQ